jgi:hypothetical protein
MYSRKRIPAIFPAMVNNNDSANTQHSRQIFWAQITLAVYTPKNQTTDLHIHFESIKNYNNQRFIKS